MCREIANEFIRTGDLLDQFSKLMYRETRF